MRVLVVEFNSKRLGEKESCTAMLTLGALNLGDAQRPDYEIDTYSGG